MMQSIKVEVNPNTRIRDEVGPRVILGNCKYCGEKVHLDDLDLYVIMFIALATSVLL